MNSDNHLQLLDILQKSKQEAVDKNEQTCHQWKIVKAEYEKVKETLETLPDNLSLPVLVPIGTKALMRGKIVHTNEIMVCLGENYFVKQSAKGAQEICKRRITKIDQMLEDLDKEHKYFTSQQNPMMKEAFATDEIIQEIYEPYDEEKEQEWRVRHRQKVREYKQNLAQLKKNTTKIETEDDIMKRLDELALQEELEEEIARLQQSDDDETEDDDESETEDEEESSDNENAEEENAEDENQSSDEAEEKSTKLKENENFKKNRIIKQVSFSEINNIKRFEEENEKDENDEEENIHIYIQHTPKENPTEKTINDINDIQSPSDLYMYHKNEFTPKSILKVKSSEKINELVTLNNDNFLEQQFEKNIEKYQRKACPITALGDVIEKNPNEETKIEKTTENRPVSRFKKARQNVLRK